MPQQRKDPTRRINVVWFKCTDLRTHDHAALKAAHAEGLPVLHLYIFDPFWYSGTTRLVGFPKTGIMRTKFQLEALADLGSRLKAAGHSLCTRSGISTAACFEELCADYEVNAVFAFHEICSEELAIESRVLEVLRRHGHGSLRLFWGFELYHRDDLNFDPSKARGPFNSYTAFRKRVEESSSVRPSSQGAPKLLVGGKYAIHWTKADPHLPDARHIMGKNYNADLDVGGKDARAEMIWQGGETAALARVNTYLWEEDSLRLEYVGATMTMDPAKSCMRDKAMSKLSPWLAHGCISPRLLYEEVKRYEREMGKSKSTYWIVHELLWRDFSRFGSMNAGTSIFKIGGPSRVRPSWRWLEDKQLFQAWQSGMTGFPLIDCFMRELKVTGYCNHMGRECSGWFLIGDLGMDWRMGAEWFESVLLDYEPCANWFNWTYRCLPAATRGGAHGFLKDNPGHRLQGLEILKWGTQHDPDAVYIKRWIPELAPLPATVAREPWRLGLHGDSGNGGNRDDEASIRPAPHGSFEVSRQALRKLLDMGFDEKAAAIALYRTWGDTEAAAALLLSDGGDEDLERGDDDDLARAIALSLENTAPDIDKATDGPIFVDDSDQEASRHEDMSSNGAFRYGIDYPFPVIAPVSIQGTEDQEAVARKAQADRDQQISVAKRRRSNTAGRTQKPWNKESWEDSRWRWNAETPTAAVSSGQGTSFCAKGKGKSGAVAGGGCHDGMAGSDVVSADVPRGGGHVAKGKGKDSERKRRWGAKDAARRSEADDRSVGA